MMNSHLETAAYIYHLNGINILPAVKAKKFPEGLAWQKYRDNPADWDQLETWFASGRYDAVCLLCGNGVEAIDFDCVATMNAWLEKLAEDEAGIRLLDRLVLQRTPSGGMHVIYRVEGQLVETNQKLAIGKIKVEGPGHYKLGPDGEAIREPVKGAHVLEAKQGEDGTWLITPVLIETRGSGGLILIDPTEGYEVYQGDLIHLPILTAEERNLLIDLARSFDQGGTAIANAKSTWPREPWVPNMASLRDRYSIRTSAEGVVAMLNAAGWQDAGGDKEHFHLTRPGKEEGTSGTVRRDNGVFYCFTTNGEPFDDGKSYSPFRVRALLDFEGNLQAAEAAVLDEERDLWGEIGGGVMQPIEKALDRTEDGDVGAPFEPEVIEALAALRQISAAKFARVRQSIKQANCNVSMREFDRAVKGAAPDSCNNEDQSVADRLVEMVRGVAELFHDQDDRRYASFEHDGHVETWDLESKGFRAWLGALFYRENHKAPRDQSIKDAANALAGIAKFEGPEQKVWLRAAVHEGRYYLDMCDDDWRAIEMSADGWKVVDRPPVKFRRTPHMTSIPKPKRQGDLNLVWNSANVDEKDRPLVLAFLLEAMRPDTGFPLLELTGEQGSGKSVTQDRLRTLVDPSTSNLRTAPKNQEDIFVATANSWLVSYNNLSRLPGPTQDALCCLATGGGFATRKLFTDNEESLTEAKRPVMINGLVRLVSAQDLVDRTVGITLPLIEHRRTESDLNEQFEADLPAIIGGLLDLFCATQKMVPDVELEELPRMADFAKLGEAMAQAQGDQPGRFLALYKENQRATVIEAMEASPVACAARDLVMLLGEWSGTMKGLFEVLWPLRVQGESWPRGPRGLGAALRRAAPGLRKLGVEVEFPPKKREGHQVALHYNPDACLDDDLTEIMNDEAVADDAAFMQRSNVSPPPMDLDPTAWL